MTATRTAEAAARLQAAHRGGPLVTADPAFEPGSIDEAHDIQAAVMRGLEAKTGGWKVGRWSADDPLFYAPVRANLIRSAPDMRDTRLRGLELEVGFRIDAALPAADDPDFLQKLAAAVTPLPVFEVVDSRLADPTMASPLWRLADFQLNAGLILGTPLARSWTPEEFARPVVRLTADGEDVCNGPATLNTSTPFGMLADLVRQCRHGSVMPDHVVTTGSFTGLRFFAKGSQLTGEIQGMAPLTMTFAA